jgi:hypothetical protein
MEASNALVFFGATGDLACDDGGPLWLCSGCDAGTDATPD